MAIALHKVKEASGSLQNQLELGKTFLGTYSITKTKTEIEEKIRLS